MLRLAKVCVRGIPIGLTLVALALAGGITNVQATPFCTSTAVVPVGGETILTTDPILGSGGCVQSGDKLFGSFEFFIPGNPTFSVTFNPGTNSIELSGPFARGTNNGWNYEVEALSGHTITQMAGSIAATQGTTHVNQFTTPASADGPIMLLVVNDEVFNEPSEIAFPNVTDLQIRSVLAGTADNDASAVLNTFTQFPPLPTPEPAALELLGMALTGLGAFGLRRKS